MNKQQTTTPAGHTHTQQGSDCVLHTEIGTEKIVEKNDENCFWKISMTGRFNKTQLRKVDFKRKGQRDTPKPEIHTQGHHSKRLKARERIFQK